MNDMHHVDVHGEFLSGSYGVIPVADTQHLADAWADDTQLEARSSKRDVLESEMLFGDQ